MKYVLLSGGSGKRLWPLSNATRSKQFLKLLKTINGYESMVQRVYRQIRQTGFNDEIIVVTGHFQVDSIRNQLGNNVDILIEPERRGTYPAVLLAASYLYFQKHIKSDEVIIVLPIDTYADITFFESLKMLSYSIEQNKSNLSLLGAVPTYPTDKYGYIIPEPQRTKNNFLMAKYFKEKPLIKEAEKYIADGAFWNCGVFAFRLEYIINKIYDNLKMNSFKEIFNRYSEIKEVSFDCEIVERESFISIVEYHGVWMDLGTWNTLTEQLKENTIGKVLLDDEAINTHVINELDIPIIVLGTENIIVAASPDGILVSNKHKSSYLKPYVDKINQSPKYEEFNWGEYKVIDSSNLSRNASYSKSQTKHYYIKSNKTYYDITPNNCDTHIVLISGIGRVILDSEDVELHIYASFYIPQNSKFKIEAISDMEFIEIQIIH